MTPADVHYGRAEQLTTARRQILIEAQRAHPERFVRGTPQPPVLPPQAWINPPLPWCINTGKSLIPLTLRFLAQKRNLLIPLELSRVMHQGRSEAELHRGKISGRGGTSFLRSVSTRLWSVNTFATKRRKTSGWNSSTSIGRARSWISKTAPFEGLTEISPRLCRG